MDSWLDSWHSVHTIVSVTDSLRKGRKGKGRSKVWHPGWLWAPRDWARSPPEAGAREQEQECASSHAKVLLPVNISAWRCSATLRSPSSVLISRLCTARGDVERRSLLASTKRETILASLGHAGWFAVIPGPLILRVARDDAEELCVHLGIDAYHSAG